MYKEVSLEDYPSYIDSLIENPHEDYISMIIPEGRFGIALSDTTELSFEAPEEAIVIQSRHIGGTILGFSDGISLFALTNKYNNPNWGVLLCDYLNTQGVCAEIKGNDVLVDSYKVAGFMDKWINADFQYFGIHISINVDVETINKYCDKEMVKIPKGLSDYGITREEILEALGVEKGQE